MASWDRINTPIERRQRNLYRSDLTQAASALQNDRSQDQICERPSQT